MVYGVPPVPTLQALARTVEGPPQDSLHQLLLLVCEQLDMDLAYISVLDGAGNRTVRASVYADGTSGPSGFCEPLAETWCGRVVARGSFLTEDARDDASLMALPTTSTFGIVSYAGVSLRDEDGEVFGALCAFGQAPHPSLNSRDHAVLSGLAEVVAPLVRRLDAPYTPPRGAIPLAAVAEAVEDAYDVERLSRPLLQALGEMTGLASAYLTVVHEDVGLQEIRYAHNASTDFELPEGLLVPWDDTLCKRALDEGRPCTTNVPEVWGDSDAATAMNISVYVSVPVERPDGTLWGTLCAADSVEADSVEAHLPTMRLFARLIAAAVDRESAQKRASQESDTDPLTGCSSRRAVQPWLFHHLAELPDDEVVVAAYVDLDGLKVLDDVHADAARDAVLVQLAHRLRAAARPGDLVASLGSDEFLVAARMPRVAVDRFAARLREAASFTLLWRDEDVAVDGLVGVAHSDGHDGPSLVAAADTALHRLKHPL